MFFDDLRSKRVVRAGSVFLITAGICGVLAWLFGWRTYLQLIPGAPLMSCDAALAFAVLGVGFLAASMPAVKLARACAAAILIFSAAATSAPFFGRHFSLHIFFPDQTALVSAPRPPAGFVLANAIALVFFCAGSFLILIVRPKLERYSLNAASVLASGIPLLGIFGAVLLLAHVVDPNSWTVIFGKMSMPSCICTLAAGACACDLFWHKTQGSERRLSSAAGTLALLSGLMLFAGLNSALISDNRLALETAKKVETVSRQVNLLREIADSVRQAEEGERGYLLTADPRYLQSYRQGLEEVEGEFAALRLLGAGGTETLHSLTGRKLSELAETIRLEQSGQHEEAVALVKSENGPQLVEAIEAESNRLAEQGRARRSALLAGNSATERPLEFSLVLSSAIAAVMILLAIYFLRQEVRRRTRLEEELRQNSRDLQKKVADRTAEIRKFTSELEEESARRLEVSQRLHLSLSLAKVVTWKWTPADNSTIWAGSVEEVFGRTAEQLNCQAAVLETLLPEDRTVMADVVARSIRERKRFEAEFRIVRPDGTVRWIAGLGDVITDADNRVVGVAGINFDISDRKQVEQRLATSEQHFRELAESMPLIVWTAHADGTLEYLNHRWSKVTGLPSKSVTFEDRLRAVHPDDIESLLRTRQKALEAGGKYDMEFRLYNREEHEYRWQWSQVIPVYDNQGKVARWYGTFTDIHERKVAELRLAESEASLRKREQQLALLFQKGLAGDYVWDLGKNEVDAHPGIWALYGEPKGSGRAPASWFLSRHPGGDLPPMHRDHLVKAQGDGPLDGEHRIVWPDGTLRWMASRSITMRDALGAPMRVHGLGFDITELKTASLRALESERQLRELADAMPQIVWRTAPNGELDYCNARWLEYSGAAALQHPSLLGSIHRDDVETYQSACRRGFSGDQPFEIEFRLLRAADQSHRWHLARLVPYRNLDGKLLHWFGTATDIHEQKLSADRLAAEVASRAAAMRELETKETQLLRSLVEKNTLFREMHHRVKNNLQVISSLLNMQSNVLKDQVAAGALRESHQRVLSMALIHEQLYGDQESSQINFAEFTERLVAELRHSYSGRESRVTTRLNVARVFLQITQATPLGLILNELVSNAFKYAYPKDKSGEIVVTLKESAGEVSLAVSDHGVGLPGDFDWQNSESMGLPIVGLLAQQLGGSFSAASQEGCTVKVTFLKELEQVKATTTAA